MLTVEPDATCAYLFEDDAGVYPCGDTSRFVVERTDEQRGATEACEGHLPDMVLDMAGGDTEVPLLVTIRWDRETEAERLARVMTP